MPEPDVPGALAGSAEEDLGRGGVGILLQKVMFHHPGVVVTKLIGELKLIERLLQQVVLARRRPGARQLMFIEHAELHAECFLSDRRTVKASYSYSQS